MKNTSGEKAANASPSQESKGSVPLTNWAMAYTLTRASQVTKPLMNIDLSKFNVVNSRATCENTGTVLRHKYNAWFSQGLSVKPD